jgi:hypothetical protein
MARNLGGVDATGQQPADDPGRSANFTYWAQHRFSPTGTDDFLLAAEPAFPLLSSIWVLS